MSFVRLLPVALCLAVSSVALAQESPYPASEAIPSVEFHWDTLFQGGKGSDQWPMTWGQDGHVYAAWGDGWGWNVQGPKYSMGVTRLIGRPPQFKAEDLWGIGPGRGVAKPEALIGLDDRIVMFWTNEESIVDDDTAVAVSTDNGQSWEIRQEKFLPAAAPGYRVRSIVQYGRGYAGAPDDFVYIYFGPNRGSDLDLARAPKDEILTSESYEWFTGTGDEAQWSGDFSARKPAFSDPNGYVWHVGVSYNRGLKRYLLTKPHFTAEDDRDQERPSEAGIASFGMFESPTPYGPWATVFYEDNFRDDLVKFSYFVPTKFISDDGKTFWLAWSGWPEYDNVTFVKGTLQTRE